MQDSCKCHTKFDGSWWAYDVRGIPLCRVCDECEDEKLSKYRPEVTGRGPGRYEDVVEEQIEADF
jgi:hypothetical protein